MSATGRKPGVRIAFDDYATPRFCVDRLLEAISLPGGAWLEPCAGAGAIIGAVNTKRDDVVWTAVEIQEKYREALEATVGDPTAVHINDFLELPFEVRPWPPLFAAAVLNPPYALAEEVIRKCQGLALVTAALMRVNFLAGSPVKNVERFNWLRAWTPDVYVLPNRPSFTSEGTDATEYCWMVFDQRRQDSRGALRILAATAKEERRRKGRDNGAEPPAPSETPTPAPAPSEPSAPAEPVPSTEEPTRPETPGSK